MSRKVHEMRENKVLFSRISRVSRRLFGNSAGISSDRGTAKRAKTGATAYFTGDAKVAAYKPGNTRVRNIQRSGRQRELSANTNGVQRSRKTIGLTSS